MAKLLNKCPICGDRLQYSALMQYSDIYKIKSNGKLTKNRIRKEDVGSMECGYISCISCDFITDCSFECGSYPYIKIWQNRNQFFYDDLTENAGSF